jgi:hypothetical protein
VYRGGARDINGTHRSSVGWECRILYPTQWGPGKRGVGVGVVTVDKIRVGGGTQGDHVIV